MNGAKYIQNSKNKKISGHKNTIDTTYTSIKHSCPNSCQMKQDGTCYAMLGPTQFHVSKLDKEAEGKTSLQLARVEAKAINESYNSGIVPNGRMLRLHTAGDTKSPSAAKVINKAVGKWQARGGGLCYGYTHAWSEVLREVWSNVSMLASISSIKEVDIARENGYAVAIVVGKHLSEKVYKLPNCDVKWIPCPSQTKKISCAECKLCARSEFLFKNNYGIAFEAHGVRKNSLVRRLNVLND